MGFRQSVFGSKYQSTRKKVFLSLLPSLDSWEAEGYLLLLTGVYRGQEFRFISVSLLVLWPPSQRLSWWVRDGVGVRVERLETVSSVT